MKDIYSKRMVGAFSTAEASGRLMTCDKYYSVATVMFATFFHWLLGMTVILWLIVPVLTVLKQTGSSSLIISIASVKRHMKSISAFLKRCSQFP